MNSLFKGFVIVLCLAFASCSPAPRCPQPSREEAQKAQEALADFAVNLFKNVSSKDESKNQAISPLSIALGLALLESGAEGQTREEIKRALLETSATREDVLNVYVSLEQQLQIKKDKTQLTIANGLFQDKNLRLKDDFTSLIKNCFKSEVDQVDFQDQLEQARQKVNRFVSQKTQQKIPELFKQGDLKQDDRIVLANAVYFKASWKQSFSKGQTRQDTFYRNGQDQQQVQFMQETVSLRHADSQDVSALEIPYDDQELSMVLVLPKQRDGMRQMEKKLTGQQLRDILSRLQQKQVQVQLPKFNVRSHVDLKTVLTRMGLESLFSRNADFSRMSETKITIDSGVHEAYISVDENGTEGAAATGFAGKAMASFEPAEPSTQFKADHPFLYAVVHKQTGAIVFLGKVNSIDKQE
jgi:serpin B